MGKLWGGGALLALALFMVAGFLRSGADPFALTTLFALLIAIGLPAVGGSLLLARHFGVGRRIGRRREELRRDTLEAEILRMAARHEGRLTVVEGVWFDHHELEAIWEMERDRFLARGPGGKVARPTEVGSEVLFQTVFWAPDLVFVGAHAAGHTVAAAAEASTALGAVGDAAGSVFETILEIVAGIFG